MEKAANKTLFSRYRIIIFIFIAVFIAWQCRHFIFPKNKIQRVILISIDTCRADYLSCYGYPENTTPNIDKFAAEGVRFENVISPVPQTLPAHSSMLTGTIPVYHEVHDNMGFKLGPEQLTLAEILLKNGFRTGAVISAFVLDSQFGMDQGFDYYNDHFEEEHKAIDISERIGDETSRVANEWIEQNADDNFFLFVHYYDPHFDYEPPEPFASKFNNNLYAGEIAFTDHCIGQVLGKLKELGLYDSTLIIITADHGEMLGEHGEMTHAYYIYQSAIKVPLIIRFPNSSGPKTVKEVVGLVDIVPTVCNLLDIEAPAQVQGKDLSGYMQEEGFSYPDRYVYCESLFPTKYDANPLYGVVTDKYKYIQTTRDELYDLAVDPKEGNNILEQKSQHARILKDELMQIMESSIPSEGSGGKTELDAETRRRLESLGYVGGVLGGDAQLDPTRDDPKDRVDLYRVHAAVPDFIEKQKFDEATALCEEVLEKWPKFYKTHLHLSKILMMQNRYSEAIGSLKEVLRSEPDQFEANNRMGMILSMQNKFDQAIKYYKKGVEIDPTNVTALNNYGTALVGMGKIDEGIVAFKKAIEIYPDHSEAHNNILYTFVKNDRLEEAAEHAEEMVALAPEQRLSIYNEFGVLLLQNKKLDFALKYFDKSIQYFPDEPEAYFHHGNVLMQQKKLQEGIKHFEDMRSRWPDDAKIYYNIGVFFKEMKKPEQAVVQFNKALSLNAEYILARYTLAMMLSEHGKLDEAKQHFEKLLEINAEQFLIHNELAFILLKQQNLDGAPVHFRQSLQLNPNQPEILYNMARLGRQQGNMAQAVEYWERALKLRSDWLSVINKLAWTKATSGDDKLYDPEEAVELALRGCEINEYKNAGLLDTLAAAYAGVGDFDKAIETAQKALEVAQEEGKQRMAGEIQKHLDFYKAGRLWRENK